MTDTAVRAPGSTFVERTVEAAGFTVRYLEAGDGPAVLYLPGAGGPVVTFALDALAERFRVIVLELPGWGAQPNDIADFESQPGCQGQVRLHVLEVFLQVPGDGLARLQRRQDIDKPEHLHLDRGVRHRPFEQMIEPPTAVKDRRSPVIQRRP